MMAKALSGLTDAPMLTVKSTQLIGEHVGEGAARHTSPLCAKKDLSHHVLCFSTSLMQ